jgi:signal transduction histidine kinase
MITSIGGTGPVIATVERPAVASQDEARKPAARLWIVFLVSGLTVAWLYPFFPRRGVTQSVIAVLIPAAAVLAVLVGMRLHRPERQGAWYLVAGAQTAWVVAGFIWFPMESLFHARHAFPSIIDALILGAYPAFVVGLWWLMRSGSQRDRTKLMDASLLTIGAALLLWIFLMSPTAAATGLGLTARVASLGYPVMDILLIACVVRFAINARRATPAVVLLLAFSIALLAGDIALLAGELITHGAYEVGQIFDCFWWSSFVLLGTAALHPSMSKMHEIDEAPAKAFSRLHLLVLGSGCAIAPASIVIVIVLNRDSSLDDVVISSAALIMFFLVLGRMYGLVSDLRIAESERQRLLRHIIRSAESERSRIAYELHDAPIQRLAALGLRLAAMSRRIKKGSREQASGLLEELQTALGTEIEGLRRLMVGLRPPSLDQAGLRLAVEDQIEAFNAEGGATCSVDIELLHPLAPELETTIFRVIQEALRNAAQHARCSHASVSVCEVARGIEMSVNDDGVGFRSDHLGNHGYGIASMREHVQLSKGAFEVISSPGRGTTIKAVFALDRDLS